MKNTSLIFTVIGLSLIWGPRTPHAKPHLKDKILIEFFDHKNCEDELGSVEVHRPNKSFDFYQLQNACEQGFSDGPYRNIDAIQVSGKCLELVNESDYTLKSLRRVCAEKIRELFS